MADINVAVDPKADAAKQARKQARKDLRDYAKTLKDGDKVRIMIFAVIGSGAGRGRQAGSGLSGQIYRLLVEKMNVSEFDLFKQFHVGRIEMNSQIRKFVNTKNPDKRIWVRFDETKEVYTVAYVGAKAPVGWDGPKPAEVKSL